MGEDTIPESAKADQRRRVSEYWRKKTAPSTPAQAEAGELRPTVEQINRAALKWCGEKERETFLSDVQYFENHWRAFPGLRAYVEREAAS